METEAAMLSV